MSFETEKHKLQQVWEDSQGNQFTIQGTVATNVIKNGQLAELPPRDIQINVLVDQGGSWQDIQAVVTAVDDNTGVSYGSTKAFQWKVELRLPEAWIALARFNFAYDRPGGVDPFLGLLVNYQWFVSVDSGENLDAFGFTTPNPQRIITATWYIDMSLQKVGATIPSDFKGKLYFTLLNPNFFS